MPEEREFEVIDRRGAGRDTTEAKPPPEAAAAIETEEPEAVEADTVQPEDLLDEDLGAGFGGMPANVVDIVTMSLGMLNEIAWVKMGLVPDPISGQISPDPVQARLAIDCAADLAHRLESHVDGKTKRDLEVLIQNLKLNFVRNQAPKP